MPNQRARRRRAARRRERTCDVPYCDNACKCALPDCSHGVCYRCMFNVMGAPQRLHGVPVFGFRCPICRHEYNTGIDTVKVLMFRYSSSHSKDMHSCEDNCGQMFRVTHRAWRGCFDCKESDLDLALVDDNSCLEFDYESDRGDPRSETECGSEPEEEAGGANSFVDGPTHCGTGMSS